jgi:hypothetical protein
LSSRLSTPTEGSRPATSGSLMAPGSARSSLRSSRAQRGRRGSTREAWRASRPPSPDNPEWRLWGENGKLSSYVQWSHPDAAYRLLIHADRAAAEHDLLSADLAASVSYLEHRRARLPALPPLQQSPPRPRAQRGGRTFLPEPGPARLRFVWRELDAYTRDKPAWAHNLPLPRARKGVGGGDHGRPFTAGQPSRAVPSLMPSTSASGRWSGRTMEETEPSATSFQPTVRPRVPGLKSTSSSLEQLRLKALCGTVSPSTALSFAGRIAAVGSASRTF